MSIIKEIEIVQAKTKQDCEICDKLLSKLIAFESSLDNSIMSTVDVKNMHEKRLDNENYHLTIAKIEGSPVGFLCGRLKTPKGLTTVKTIVEVSTLYIEEQFRDKGVGRALMRDFENWAKTRFEEDCLIEIMYINNNENAKRFYEKLGYLPVRTTLRK